MGVKVDVTAVSEAMFEAEFGEDEVEGEVVEAVVVFAKDGEDESVFALYCGWNRSQEPISLRSLFEALFLSASPLRTLQSSPELAPTLGNFPIVALLTPP
ncbi:hypothetical protein ACLB2K_038459 [Fragaria x ananassa]